MDLFEVDKHLLEWINQNRIKPLDNYFIWITDTASLVAMLITLIVLMIGFRNKNKIIRLKGWHLLIAFIINAIVVNIIKYTVNRERPFEHDTLIEKLSTGGSPSFPSGHTADAFVIAVLMTLLFTKAWKFLLPIWLWAFAVAYSRLVLGVHYPSDVLGSIFIGALIAIVTNNIFKKRKAKEDDTMAQKY